MSRTRSYRHVHQVFQRRAAGIRILISQHSLYITTLVQHSSVQLLYYSNEAAGTRDAVVRSQVHAREDHDRRAAKAVVTTNPGKPNGAVRAFATLSEVHGHVSLADEVYRANSHERTRHPFTSFGKTVFDLNSRISLISIHSISNGFPNERGRRAGYFQTTNVSPKVDAFMYKMVFVGLCTAIAGQIDVNCMVRLGGGPIEPTRYGKRRRTRSTRSSPTHARHVRPPHRDARCPVRLRLRRAVSVLESRSSIERSLGSRSRFPSSTD
jgi:aspartate/methionine/tyrosine aminotransferase